MSILSQNQFSIKSILVFGVTLKTITIDTWNFHWMFILIFSRYDNIFNYWFVLSCLQSNPVSNCFGFLTINKILFVGSKSLKIKFKAPYIVTITFEKKLKIQTRKCCS